MIKATYTNGKSAPLGYGQTVATASDIERIEAPPEVAFVQFEADVFAIDAATGDRIRFKASVRYSPGQSLIEAQSLKRYLLSFADRPIYSNGEGIAAEIVRLLFDAVFPAYLIVELTREIDGLSMRVKAAIGSPEGEA